MEFLRDLMGNMASGIIRLAVAVGVLAAAYLFVVKPVLHTTDNAINSANKSFEQSFGPHGSISIDSIDKTIRDANRQVQIQIRRSFHMAKQNGNPERLLHCVQAANGDVHRMQRCTLRFSH
jgi:hypothetical protein